MRERERESERERERERSETRAFTVRELVRGSTRTGPQVDLPPRLRGCSLLHRRTIMYLSLSLSIYIYIYTHVYTHEHGTANLRTKILDFRGFDSGGSLDCKGWNSQARREFPRNGESTKITWEIPCTSMLV